MKKEEIFFGECGLTSTSANHVANLAKEYTEAESMKLHNLGFVNSSIAIIGQDGLTPVTHGMETAQLTEIKGMLCNIAEANSLISWLREAIKARETMTREVNNKSLLDFASEHGFTILDCPRRPEMNSTDYYIAQMTVGERKTMYELIARSAVIGKFIHPGGSFSNAREEMHKRVTNETEVRGNGRDTVIYRYAPSCDTEAVDNMFFELQQEHRAIQAELNGINHAIEQKQKDDYAIAIAEYNRQYDKHVNSKEIANNEFEAWKLDEKRRIQELKIIIPNSLSDIYIKISRLGKK